jgi:hypothetical protein
MSTGRRAHHFIKGAESLIHQRSRIVNSSKE